MNLNLYCVCSVIVVLWLSHPLATSLIRTSYFKATLCVLPSFINGTVFWDMSEFWINPLSGYTWFQKMWPKLFHRPRDKEHYWWEERPVLHLHRYLQIARTDLNGQNEGCVSALILSMENEAQSTLYSLTAVTEIVHGQGRIWIRLFSLHRWLKNIPFSGLREFHLD